MASTVSRVKKPMSSTTPDLKDFFSAKEAAQLLRIKPQTLYAYVSRGWIQSVAHDKRPGHFYLREDVERMRVRGHARAEGGVYKAGSARWSEPVVQTSITTITVDGPAYRGHAALELARRNLSFECVAELLWSGIWMEEQEGWPSAPADVAMDSLARTVGADTSQPDIVKLFSLYVMSLAARSSGSEDLRDGNTIVAARTVLMGLPGCLGFLTPKHRFAAESKAQRSMSTPLVTRVLDGLGAAPSSEAAMAVNAALVLLADHELTPQTFAARLAASSGASLYFCLSSALSAHSGSRIRRGCDKVEDVLIAAHEVGLTKWLADMGDSVSTLPGFNHALYPDGDPRAAYLLELARQASSGLRRGSGIGALLDDATRKLGVRPNAETGLVVLCHALRLPYRSAGAILTIARCAGWIAHVIEQRLAGTMLRPRARYL